MTAARAAKRRGARDRLKGRKVRRGHYDVVVGDGDLPALLAVLEQAEKDARVTALAAARETDPDSSIHRFAKAAEQRVSDAQAAIEAQVERIWFRALPGSEYEELRIAYPAPKITNDEGKEEADIRTLWPITPILAARCAEDPEYQDEEFWAAELAEWPLPDRLSIQALLFDINTQPANAALAGKVFGTTR